MNRRHFIRPIVAATSLFVAAALPQPSQRTSIANCPCERGEAIQNRNKQLTV
jgi:hypothetical protein